MPNEQNNQEEIDNINPFQSGIWSSRYLQDEQWHGPHEFLLTFDSKRKDVTGSGSDDIGSFIIDGYYNTKQRRQKLIKKYQADTDNPSKKNKRVVILTVQWNMHSRQFEGTYEALTKTYSRNKFELKFVRALNDVCESV